MPEKITLYRLFISAPGDVEEEHDIIRGVLDEWNIQHGQDAHVRLEAVNWRTHTFPASGRRAQAIINRQSLDKCDIVVALFWTRFGTPTGKFDSGTEEEIMRAQRQHKPVMVYFSSIPFSRRRRMPDEQTKVEKFRKKLGTQALYHTYGDQQAFERAFRNHLALAMGQLLKQTHLK
jgi:nucleoside 2-deoxyribosyltransferase